MNLECDQETLDELDHAFKFNDAVLRHLIVKMSGAISAPSPMMREEKSRSLTQPAEEKAAAAAAAPASQPAPRWPPSRNRRRSPGTPAHLVGANEVTLTGELTAVEPLRYTPAGVPLVGLQAPAPLAADRGRGQTAGGMRADRCRDGVGRRWACPG